MILREKVVKIVDTHMQCTKIVQLKLILGQWPIKTEFGAWMVGSCDSERAIVITALLPQSASTLELAQCKE